MKVLVTGASGFLGRHVVASLRQANHTVRAMVRPSTDVSNFNWDEGVEVFRADLFDSDNLLIAFAEVDVVIHLAATMNGDHAAHFRNTITGTERLLTAMAKSNADRLVLASSFSVYDWSKVTGTLTEDSPIEENYVSDRDNYAIAKIEQERLVRRFAKAHGWGLVVLRPGSIWGSRHLNLPDIGQPVSKIQLVIAPFAKLRLSYVENCADAFVRAAESRHEGELIANVVDGDKVTAWRYAGEVFRRCGVKKFRWPVPYHLGLLATAIFTGIQSLIPRKRFLPSILVTRRYEARFRPVKTPNNVLHDSLGWVQKYSFERGLDRAMTEGESAANPSSLLAAMFQSTTTKDRHLRLAYLTSAYARAADSFIRGEVKELRELGHTVRTFSINRSDPKEAVTEEIEREQANTEYILTGKKRQLILAGVRYAITHPMRFVRAFDLAMRSAPPGIKAKIWHFAYLLEAAYLAQRLSATRVQHLHNHIGENSAMVAMLASRLSNIPYSLTIHGPGEFDQPANLALREKIAHADFVVAVSEFGRSQLCRWADHSDWNKIHVVHCGVNGTFLDAGPVPPPRGNRLVCIGRLAEQKGQYVLIDAAAKLAADTNVDFQIDLIGDGPLREQLEVRIRMHGLQDRVRILGWLSAEKIREALLDSRALVLPSLAEGLPVVIMESLALNRPVISTYVAGIPELVEHGKNGWLVPAGSGEALAAAMHDALRASPDRLQQMGAAGAAKVRENHSVATEVTKLERLFTGS